ncbi:hypothetical protein CMI48_04715 [Candidatus Pacearchaeota archaeon]|nr:hypothetical protein [Candidatus Pacearchaeota archaeon]
MLIIRIICLFPSIKKIYPDRALLSKRFISISYKQEEKMITPDQTKWQEFAKQAAAHPDRVKGIFASGILCTGIALMDETGENPAIKLKGDEIPWTPEETQLWDYERKIGELEGKSHRQEFDGINVREGLETAAVNFLSALPEALYLRRALLQEGPIDVREIYDERARQVNKWPNAPEGRSETIMGFYMHPGEVISEYEGLLAGTPQ